MNAGKFLSAGLLAAAAQLCSSCTRQRQPAEPVGPSFKIMTFNINWGGPGAEVSARAILDSGADIVCLQETNPGWEAYLRPRLELGYPHALFRHGPGAGGMAVFSKWPVKEMARATPPAGWFFGWLLEADTPAGKVQILAVHLRPALSERGGVSPGAYFATKRTRAEEVRCLHGLLAPGQPAIILGDFNDNDSSSAVQWLVKQGFTDALGEFDPKTDTWRWPTRLWTFTGRFDHVLYSRELGCCRAQVLKAGASDHLPVVAVFEKRPAPAPPER